MDIIWWYGAVSLAVTSAIGLLWLFDKSIEWIIDGLNFRKEFITWYAEKLRRRQDDERA